MTTKTKDGFVPSPSIGSQDSPYRAALKDWIKADKKWLHFETIIRALLIAEQLENEPTKIMHVSACDNVPALKRFTEAQLNDVFRAMRDQILVEVGANTIDPDQYDKVIDRLTEAKTKHEPCIFIAPGKEGGVCCYVYGTELLEQNQVYDLDYRMNKDNNIEIIQVIRRVLK